MIIINVFQVKYQLLVVVKQIKLIVKDVVVIQVVIAYLITINVNQLMIHIFIGILN